MHPSPFLLHWSDSELAGVALDPDHPGRLRLRFAAASGFCGPLRGYLRPVELVFHEAAWSGDDLALCLGGVAQGTLRVEGEPAGPVAHVSALPVDRRGAVVCEFRLISGTALRIAARRVVGDIRGDACFQESLAC